MNNKEVLIFIDDSGKLHNNKDKFVNYTCIVFPNNDVYIKFCNSFKNALKIVNKNKEIKGSIFWQKKIPNNIKKILLETINIDNNIHIFSIILNVLELRIKYKNDFEAEGILNKSIAIICDHLTKKLNITNCTLNLQIDEQIRRYDLLEYLNFYNPELLSIKNLRRKNINFIGDCKVKSHESSGVMYADLIANGINRIFNRNQNKILKIMNDFINTEIKYYIWPPNWEKSNYIKEFNDELKFKKEIELIESLEIDDIM